MKSGIFFRFPVNRKLIQPEPPKTETSGSGHSRKYKKSFHDNWIQLFFRANNAKQVTGTKEMRFVIQRKVQFDETTCNGSAWQKLAPRH